MNAALEKARRMLEQCRTADLSVKIAKLRKRLKGSKMPIKFLSCR